MDRQGVIEILTYVKGAYGRQLEYPTHDEVLDGNTEDVWLDILKPYSCEDAMGATRMIMQEGNEFPPKAPQIAKICRENQNPDKMSGEDAFGRALILLSCRSSLQVKRANNEAEMFAIKNKMVLKNEDADLVSTIANMGGLDVVNQNSDNSYFRTSFIKTYNSFVETRGQRQLKHIAGVDTVKLEERTESTEGILSELKQIGNK